MLCVSGASGATSRGGRQGPGPPAPLGVLCCAVLRARAETPAGRAAMPACLSLTADEQEGPGNIAVSVSVARRRTPCRSSSYQPKHRSPTRTPRPRSLAPAAGCLGPCRAVPAGPSRAPRREAEAACARPPPPPPPPPRWRCFCLFHGRGPARTYALGIGRPARARPPRARRLLFKFDRKRLAPCDA